jgi:hypothetical protein
MIFKETIMVYSENQTKHTNSVSETVLFNVKACGTNSYHSHIVLMCYQVLAIAKLNWR